VLSDVQSAFGVAEFIPGLGNIGAVGGATLWVFLNETQRTAALLPCCLTSFDVDASPVEFEEDNPFSGTWSGTVTAVSLGWDLGKEVLEAAQPLAHAIDERLVGVEHRPLRHSHRDQQVVRAAELLERQPEVVHHRFVLRKQGEHVGVEAQPRGQDTGHGGQGEGQREHHAVAPTSEKGQPSEPELKHLG